MANGYAWACDYCGEIELVNYTPVVTMSGFMPTQPLPNGWIKIVRASGPSFEGFNVYCSDVCGMAALGANRMEDGNG